MAEKIYAGNISLKSGKKEVTGSFIQSEGEKYYKIRNYDQMPPFFMSIVSAYDHWLFISSNGALSAGRKNKEFALFPYYTDDKIHDSNDITGSKTIVIATKELKKYLWEPFSNKYEFVYNIERNIYKNTLGNVLIFEEINKDLELIFRYKWQTGKKLGFIRHAEIRNFSDAIIQINILDGIQNILPARVNSNLQNNYSTLLDAYKKNELYDSRIGIFYLSSIPTDRAEPSEGLKANTVWSTGFENFKIVLSSQHLDRFRRTSEVAGEDDVRAARGAYFMNSTFQLNSDEKKEWYIVADVEQDLVDIEEISRILNDKRNIISAINDDIKKGSEKLSRIIRNADGFQITADDLSTSRHLTNVLFNVMRGGIFDDDSGFHSGSFRCHIENFNSKVFNDEQHFLSHLPDFISYDELINKAEENGNPDLIRLSYEFLPLVFSRRHGDPSRPWNLFSIKSDDESGRNKFHYEGNWRDIFQNWEALALSYPKYIESMIIKFVNASTVDGYNPYRISDSGIEWEVAEPENPWSNIGYWGDHQIIYLEKLLELSVKYNPEKLYKLLNNDIFCFANVPYRIKSYDEICQNPYDTIVFDELSHKDIISRTESFGADAKLIHTAEGELFHVNLFEKLLLTLCTKLSNFIPEAGIWLNTQRPEWNDANNALVGYGTSMVTLYYIRRYSKFLLKIFEKLKNTELNLTKELFQFYIELNEIFMKFSPNLKTQFSDVERKRFTDAVGQAGSGYRKLVYGRHSGVKVKIFGIKITAFLELSLKYTEHSIKTNKRDDGLYHSYNLIAFDNNNKLSVSRLYEMLEGQTAVLSSGFLNAQESILLLNALKQSKMFRSDQYSYMLYPDREPAKFVDKNNIPEEFSRNCSLFNLLEKNGDQSFVKKDRKGIFHFNGNFRNAEDLDNALEMLRKKNYAETVKQERNAILDIWEKMFNHREFTGRSGTFFGYEGLGSIYWHMVSKLLLAVGETYFNALEQNAEQNELSKLIDFYYEIRAGIGLNKSPDVFGAFPTDPYSHTPTGAGAQQPGMTGQVKEDIISRFMELGIQVCKGKVEFKPSLLRKSEFLSEKKSISDSFNSNIQNELVVNPGELTFSFCGTLVKYHLSDKQEIHVIFDNKTIYFKGLELDKEISKSLFMREHKIKRIDVFLLPKLA